MSKTKSIGKKLGGLVTSSTLSIGIASSAPLCYLLFHQPKVPQGMKKFVKNR